MVEQKRTQLFMMLVQQAGVGSLPMSHLGREELLAFMRKIERMATSERSPVIVYWSSANSRWLLPTGAEHRKLTRESLCISVFSEERDDKQEEFCFLVESQGLCMVLYGNRSEEHGADIFQCVGSMEPDMVRRAFQMMLPVWQFMDLGETNRLEDARSNAGPPHSSPKLIQDGRNEWPVVKMALAGSRFIPGDSFDSEDIEVEPLIARPGASAPPRFPEPGGSPSMPGQGIPGPAMFEADAGFNEGVVETAYLGGGERASAMLAAPPAADELTGGAQRTTGARGKRDTKGLRDLRQVWTTISEESRSVFLPDAQRIIRDIFGQLRHSNDHSTILQMAIEELTKVAFADRGLIWQLVGNELRVTHEFTTSAQTQFVDAYLGDDESQAIVAQFLSRFPDDTGSGVIAIPDTKLDYGFTKFPTLATLLELSGTHARLIAQLRCTGRFYGFLELQQHNTREWSEQDASALQSVAETLSVVVQQATDLQKRESDAQEMKLINSISEMFRESKGKHTSDMLLRSVKVVADHMGFTNAQLYLLSQDQKILVPQIATDEHNQELSAEKTDNPYVRQLFEGKGKARMINVESSRKGDPFFGHDPALVVPLEHEGKPIGVLGLWKRDNPNRKFRPGDDDNLARTICNNLASIIRADQAIAKIREDGMREQVINRVTQVTRSSPKDTDPIVEELIRALQEYFNLALCAVSLYDHNNSTFGKSRTFGSLELPPELPANMLSEKLCQSVKEELSQGSMLVFEEPALRQKLTECNIAMLAGAQKAILLPLINHNDLKAGLCLVSAQDWKLSEPDRVMLTGLAERVAAELAYKDLFEQVEKQAVTDPMTGLYNRRYFGEQLSREIDRYQRFGHPFSYIILDLDYLKKINDTLGHQFGDEAIKHIANVTKKCVRDVDTTARYGGEEFVVLLPETDVAGARVVAERMCVAIREVPVEGIGTVTASIGVSTYPYDAQDRDKLTELADQALYLAKHRGRNQVCTVSEDLMPTLNERGEEALEVQKAAIKAKAEEFQSIDLKTIAEHGLLGILGAVIKMIEAKDAYSNDRSPRAADYAGKLANALHLSREHTTIISLSAVLSNIGKIGVPEEILQKKDALTEEETRILQNSPSVGAKLLEPAKHLHRVASVVESFHEHWDGTGYPKGLRGEQIPLESRIIALIDAYVAMTSDRPWRPALSSEDAIAVIKQGAGKEWDPRLVKLFLSVLAKETK